MEDAHCVVGNILKKYSNVSLVENPDRDKSEKSNGNNAGNTIEPNSFFGVFDGMYYRVIYVPSTDISWFSIP